MAVTRARSLSSLRPTTSAEPIIFDHLFEPYVLGDLELPNRLVMAPLTRMRADADGVMGPLNAEYYAQRASAGLIIAEGTFPHSSGKSYPGQPGIETAEQIAGWRLVTDAVHGAGGRIFLQLMHGGRIGHERITPGGGRPVAPSAVRPQGEARIDGEKVPFDEPRALEPGEIPAVQEQFAQGAQNALEAGFDGVELHSANGYLLHEFLSDVTNLRSDEYGGAIENRCRFVVETARLVAERIGAERVGIRLSPDQNVNDISETESQALYPHLLGELNAFGLGYLHMMETPPDSGWSSVEIARKSWNGTLIANSNFQVDWPLELADETIAEGRADLICYGRRFISNPDLVERIRSGAPIAEADFRTFYGGGSEGYTDYPSLGSAS